MLFTEEDVIKILAMLSEREELIVRMRYGIGEDASYSCEEIAERFALSQAYIKRILRRINKEDLPCIIAYLHKPYACLLGIGETVRGLKRRLQRRRERAKELWEQRRLSHQYTKNPRSIPYKKGIYFRGEWRYVSIPHYYVGWLQIKTLGDLADCSPTSLINGGYLSVKGVHAMAHVLHSFGVPYNFSLPPLPVKKKKPEEIVDAWQAAYA